MDRIDRKLLALFQYDTRHIARSLGEAVGLSAAAVQRRLKRLRETGMIRAEVAQLDAAKLGWPITCIATVTMAAGTAPHTQLDRFKRAIAAAPEVQQCYHVTGAVDFVVVVLASTMEDYAVFVRERFEADPAVARFDTYVALDKVKTGVSTPL
jgi:Lrp/AsnC family leucine-responsive transcriptional regulator